MSLSAILNASDFNPRPPWGGRLSCMGHSGIKHGDFNPRPPWGGRPLTESKDISVVSFQSTPSVGRATHGCRKTPPRTGFQSTPSVGRATHTRHLKTAITRISIHALRGEGDTHPTFENCDYTDFNPRPPWGGRPSPSAHRGGAVHFNPRPPWGGRRDIIESIFLFLRISIHALRGEGDLKNIHTGEIYPDFNPRPPWGGRL